MIVLNVHRVLATTTAIISLACLASPGLAQNLPTAADGTVVAGGATISNPNSSTLRVELQDNRTIINWSGFSVPQGNTASFLDCRGGTCSVKPGDIAVLNRVIGSDPSYILGSLLSDSNVSVYLINPNGILFGGNSVVNLGGLIASSLNISDADFLDGSPHNFAGASAAGVFVSSGAKLSSQSDLVLLGASVDIGSLATVTAGEDVAIIAGSDVSLSFGAGSPMSITISQGTPVSNGVIVAGDVSARNIYLAMASRSSVTNALLSVKGNLQASTATATDRGVVLAAGSSANGVTVARGGGNDTSGDASLTMAATLTSARGASAPAGTAGIEARARNNILVGDASGAGSFTAADSLTIGSDTGEVRFTNKTPLRALSTFIYGNAVHADRLEAIGGGLTVSGATNISGHTDARAQIVAKSTGADISLFANSLMLNEAVADRNLSINGGGPVDAIAVSARNGSLTVQGTSINLGSAVGATSANIGTTGAPAINIAGRVLSRGGVQIGNHSAGIVNVGEARSLDAGVQIIGSSANVGRAQSDARTVVIRGTNGVSVGTVLTRFAASLEAPAVGANVTVTDQVTGGGNIFITAGGHARLNRIEATAGDISLTVGGETSGAAPGTRGSLVANGAGGDINVTGGTSFFMNEVVADNSVTVTADTIDITSVQARNGPLQLTTDVGDLAIGYGSSRATATLRSARDAIVRNRLLTRGDILIDAARDAQIAEARSTEGSVTIVEGSPQP